MGPRAGLDGRKISSPPGFDPGPSIPQSLAIPTELPGPHRCWYIFIFMYRESLDTKRVPHDCGPYVYPSHTVAIFMYLRTRKPSEGKRCKL